MLLRSFCGKAQTAFSRYLQQGRGSVERRLSWTGQDSATHIYLAGVVESDGRHFEAHTQGEQKEMDVLGLLLRRMAMWRTTQNW